MTEERGHRLLRGLRARRERHAERGKVYRIAFAAAGFLVVVLGLALVPLPGPGWLIVAVGLAMLALEFDWAERMLERAVDRLEAVTRIATRGTPLQRALAISVFVAATVGAVAYLIVWDVPFLPI